jgi:peroxiredoxin Q/BCP
VFILQSLKIALLAMPRPQTRSQASNSSANINKTESTIDAKDSAVGNPKKTIGKVEKPKVTAPSKTESVVNVGDAVPDIKVLQDDGKEVSLLELSKESALVIFMYPKANTPGCTKQACGFRDELEAFASRGYQIYGLLVQSGILSDQLILFY